MKPLMRARVFALCCFSVVCSWLILAAPALAQVEATRPENTVTGWIMRWINSVVVIVAIGWALSKARPAFRRRADAIHSAIAEGSRAKEEAEKVRLEADRKLAGIQDEIAAMRVEAKHDAEAEAQRIRELARDEAAKLDRAAELEIAAAERAARQELKAVAARLAVERAEAILREQLTPPADAQLVSNFAGNLAGSRN